MIKLIRSSQETPEETEIDRLLREFGITLPISAEAPALPGPDTELPPEPAQIVEVAEPAEDDELLSDLRWSLPEQLVAWHPKADS